MFKEVSLVYLSFRSQRSTSSIPNNLIFDLREAANGISKPANKVSQDSKTQAIIYKTLQYTKCRLDLDQQNEDKILDQ